MSTEPTKPDHSACGKRLTEGQKRAVVAAVAAGARKIAVAKRFNLNRNTVSDICKSVEAIPGSELDKGWRTRLIDEISPLCVDAIKESVMDREDVHKAAGTAIAHLKGTGVYAQDTANTQVSVLISGLSGLPKDWRENYLSTEEEDTPPPL